ncbi:MAG: type II toxin-antitoxin system VapC family toxin [bacterium]
MPSVVPDTTVWVSLIRGGSAEERIRVALRGRTAYLPSVAVYELYQGCRTDEDRRDVDAIRQAFVQTSRLITPTFKSWCDAANILGRFSRVQGAVVWKDHLMDVLILLCAVQLRARVLTSNVADVERWNQLLPTGRRVRVDTP